MAPSTSDKTPSSSNPDANHMSSESTGQTHWPCNCRTTDVSGASIGECKPLSERLQWPPSKQHHSDDPYCPSCSILFVLGYFEELLTIKPQKPVSVPNEPDRHIADLAELAIQKSNAHTTYYDSVEQQLDLMAEEFHKKQAGFVAEINQEFSKVLARLYHQVWLKRKAAPQLIWDHSSGSSSRTNSVSSRAELP